MCPYFLGIGKNISRAVRVSPVARMNGHIEAFAILWSFGTLALAMHDDRRMKIATLPQTHNKVYK